MIHRPAVPGSMSRSRCFLSNPPGVTREMQPASLDTLKDLNEEHCSQTGDTEIAQRIASYALAFRKQMAAPGTANGESLARFSPVSYIGRMAWIDVVLEKFGKAIQVWKAPTDPWEVRLHSALILATRMPAKDIPEEFRPAYMELRQGAGRVENERHGAFRATINQMDEGEANRLMSDLERLYHELHAYNIGQR